MAEIPRPKFTVNMLTTSGRKYVEFNGILEYLLLCSSSCEDKQTKEFFLHMYKQFKALEE